MPLGYSLLQEGQLVAYGARGLTAAEKKYAQIEKEMLAILVGCEKYDLYIFGSKIKDRDLPQTTGLHHQKANS